MSDWHVGQQVVCVHEFETHPHTILPVKGLVYTIRGIVTFRKRVGLLLEELVNPPRKWSDGFLEASFEAEGFRPVKKTDISVFTEMLAPVKQKEPA